MAPMSPAGDAATRTWAARWAALSATGTTCADPNEPNDRRKSRGGAKHTDTSARFRHRRGPERAERQAEVEGRADDHDHIGLLEEPPGTSEGKFMVGREAAASHAVDERRYAQLLDAALQRRPRAVPPHVASCHQHRPLS